MTEASNSKPATLWVNADAREVNAGLHNTSLLHYLREHCLTTGTKEGCGSGDCGACTVILLDPRSGKSQSVNSCITPVGAAIGLQVITVEGVGSIDKPHPVQAAMVSEHGSQCGFCTPGFVMSMVAEQLSGASLTERERADDVRSISGNLCRCTGYRPILSAARVANQAVAEAEQPASGWVPAIKAWENTHQTLDQTRQHGRSGLDSYHSPQTESELQNLLVRGLQRNTNPIIAGGTDLWLLVSQSYVDFDSFLDLSRVESLKTIDSSDSELSIGAGASHADLLAFFASGEAACPAIVRILERFGSPQIRNRATIGGNIAGGSPIADWPPLLMALDARLTLTDASGDSRQVAVNEFFEGYRSTVLNGNEYIARIHLPASTDPVYSRLAADKISKREEDDISSVMGAFDIRMTRGLVDRCRIAFGGVAATPVRLDSLEQSLLAKALSDDEIDQACTSLAGAITPLTDVRASAEYRRAMSASLLNRALLRARGTPAPHLGHSA